MKSNLLGFDDEAYSNGNGSFNFKKKNVYSTKNNPMCGITLPQWLGMLMRYFCFIEIQYIPRVIFISFLSIFNTFLSIIESIYFEALISSVILPDDPVFIIGHPRTGTTLIHNLLASDEILFFTCTNFCAGFPSSFLWFEKYGKYLFSSIIEKTRPMDSMPLHFDLPQEDELATNLLSHGTSYYMPLWFMAQETKFRRYFDFNADLGATPDDEKKWIESFCYFLRKLTLRSQRQYRRASDTDITRRLLLKSPVHTARVPLLRRLFPRARFIYIHRNPLEVLQSAVHMADTAYWYCYLNTPTNEQVTEFIFWQFEYMWRQYDAAVVVQSTSSSTNTVSSGTEENDELGVDFVNKHSPHARGDSDSAISCARRVTGDVLEIAYVDLLNDPINTIKSMYAHAGIEWSSRTEAHFTSQTALMGSYTRNSHTNLPAHAVRSATTRWKSYFETFGYSADPSE